MSVQVKLYIQPDNEIRRFVLDNSADFAALQQRVKELVGRDVRLYWQDSEGDHIVCGSDDELNAARQFKDASGLIRLYARPGKPAAGESGEEKRVHRRITCDGCQGQVQGTRYKCLECPDYDLCEACEQKGTHQEHDMVAVRRPRSCEWKKLFGHGYGAREGFHGPPPPHCGAGPCGPGPRGPCGPGPHGPAGPGPHGPGARGPCGSRRRGPGGFGGFMPPFIAAGLGNLMQNLGQTVEMDIDMTRPLPEVIADITKKVQEAISRAQNGGAEQTGETQPEEKKEATSAQEEVNIVASDEVIATATAVAEAVTVVADMINQSFGTGSRTPSEADGWTHLQAESAQADEVTIKPEEPSQGQQPQPGNRIEDALKKMEEMGFGNEGNLLRRLLENYNGDIVRVLDSIK